MVRAYVQLLDTLDEPQTKIFAMLLPSAGESKWAELKVQQSQLGGYGVFPSKADETLTESSSTQVLLPFFGLETVVSDARAKSSLFEVLKQRQF